MGDSGQRVARDHSAGCGGWKGRGSTAPQGCGGEDAACPPTSAPACPARRSSARRRRANGGQRCSWTRWTGCAERCGRCGRSLGGGADHVRDADGLAAVRRYCRCGSVTHGLAAAPENWPWGARSPRTTQPRANAPPPPRPSKVRDFTHNGRADRRCILGVGYRVTIRVPHDNYRCLLERLLRSKSVHNSDQVIHDKRSYKH